MSKRLDALKVWQEWQERGTLYEWNGKLQGQFPDVRWAYGADCSGFVSGGIYVATKGKVDLRAWWNADRFHKDLPCTATPKPGDLVVYGTAERADHVMVFVGDGRVLGACGGGRETITEALAKARGARVQFRKKADYRMRRGADGKPVSDFLGFRVATWLDQ